MLDIYKKLFTFGLKVSLQTGPEAGGSAQDYQPNIKDGFLDVTEFKSNRDKIKAILGEKSSLYQSLEEGFRSEDTVYKIEDLKGLQDFLQEGDIVLASSHNDQVELSATLELYDLPNNQDTTSEKTDAAAQENKEVNEALLNTLLDAPNLEEWYNYINNTPQDFFKITRLIEMGYTFQTTKEAKEMRSVLKIMKNKLGNQTEEASVENKSAENKSEINQSLNQYKTEESGMNYQEESFDKINIDSLDQALSSATTEEIDNLYKALLHGEKSIVKKYLKDIGYNAKGLSLDKKEISQITTLVKQSMKLGQKINANGGEIKREDFMHQLLDFDGNGKVEGGKANFYVGEGQSLDAIQDPDTFSILLQNLSLSEGALKAQFIQNPVTAKEKFQQAFGQKLQMYPLSALTRSGGIEAYNKGIEEQASLTEKESKAIDEAIQEIANKLSLPEDIQKKSLQSIKLEAIALVVGEKSMLGASFDVTQLTSNLVDSVGVGFYKGIPGIGIHKEVLLGRTSSLHVGAVNFIPMVGLVWKPGELAKTDVFNQTFKGNIHPAISFVKVPGAAYGGSLSYEYYSDNNVKGTEKLKKDLSEILESFESSIEKGDNFDTTDYAKKITDKNTDAYTDAKKTYEQLKSFYEQASQGITDASFKKAQLKNVLRSYENYYSMRMNKAREGLSFNGVGIAAAVTPASLYLVPFVDLAYARKVTWNEVERTDTQKAIEKEVSQEALDANSFEKQADGTYLLPIDIIGGKKGDTVNVVSDAGISYEVTDAGIVVHPRKLKSGEEFLPISQVDTEKKRSAEGYTLEARFKLGRGYEQYTVQTSDMLEQVSQVEQESGLDFSSYTQFFLDSRGRYVNSFKFNDFQKQALSGDYTTAEQTLKGYLKGVAEHYNGKGRGAEALNIYNQLDNSSATNQDLAEILARTSGSVATRGLEGKTASERVEYYQNNEKKFNLAGLESATEKNILALEGFSSLDALVKQNILGTLKEAYQKTNFEKSLSQESVSLPNTSYGMVDYAQTLGGARGLASLSISSTPVFGPQSVGDITPNIVKMLLKKNIDYKNQLLQNYNVTENNLYKLLAGQQVTDNEGYTLQSQNIPQYSFALAAVEGAICTNAVLYADAPQVDRILPGTTESVTVAVNPTGSSTVSDAVYTDSQDVLGITIAGLDKRERGDNGKKGQSSNPGKVESPPQSSTVGENESNNIAGGGNGAPVDELSGR